MIFLITNLAATSRFLNLNLSYISDIIVPIFSYYLKEVIFMELWFSEFQSKNIKFSLKVNKVLSIEKSEYQTIAVYENEDMGRILALDNVIQLTTKDEFTYHEMIAHVPMFTHNAPEKVLIIGGGDGGTLREVLKHPVKHAHLVDIDRKVIETSKKFFPYISYSFEDPRVKVFIEDGIEFVKKNSGYDVIIIDSTDPIGPAVNLFSRDFYKDVFNALNKDGIMVAQTESPFLYADVIKRIYDDISSIYPYTNIYTSVVPTYPGAFWTFSMGSKMVDPLKKDITQTLDIETKYYTKSMHKACLDIPPFLKDMLSK